MTQNATTPHDGATTHARTSRRGLLGGLALALGAAPAAAVAEKGVTTDDALADDGPTFLAWEAEHETKLQAACAIPTDRDNIAASDAAFRSASRAAGRILSEPCRSRTAAMVKLRVLLHPEAGHFSCGEGPHDETALQQVLAVLGDSRGEWEAPSKEAAFSGALAAWREAEDAYGEVTNRLDQEGVHDGPEIDAADARSAQALAVMLAAPTPSRAMLADKLQAITADGYNPDRMAAFIATLRRGEG